MLEQPALGQRLRALRLQRGLSQAALAGTEISTGYLSRLESGVRRPTPRVMEYLTARLSVPLSEFEGAAGGGVKPSGASLEAQILAAVVSSADDELTEELTDALATGDTWDPALRWQGWWLLAAARGRQGRHEDEHAAYLALVRLSDEIGSDVLRTRSLTQLSRCARVQGDNVAARLHATEAHRLAAGLSVADQAAALQALVSAEAELGLLGEARTHADEVCALVEATGGRVLVEALWAAATVRIRQGDHTGAQQLLERALSGSGTEQDLTMWIRLRLAAASLYLQVPDPRTDRARALLDEAAPVVQLLGTELLQQQLLTLRGHLAFAEGRFAEAQLICRQVGEEPLLLSFRDRVRFQALRGRLLIADGAREEGIQALQDLARECAEAKNVELAAEIWRLLAEALAAGYPAPAAAAAADPARPARKRPRSRTSAR